MTKNSISKVTCLPLSAAQSPERVFQRFFSRFVIEIRCVRWVQAHSRVDLTDITLREALCQHLQHSADSSHPKHALRVSAKKMNGSLTLIPAALSSAVHFPPGPEGRSSACTLLGQRLVIESDLHLIVPVVLLWSRQGVDCRGVLYNQVVTVSRRVSAERHYAKKR